MIERNYFEWPVYGLDQKEKYSRLAPIIDQLTQHHGRHCRPYADVLSAHGFDPAMSHNLEDAAYLPVRLFKEFELKSVAQDDVFKVLTSSGTTSQQVSRIVLDRETAAAQAKALVLILQQFLGRARIPMLIIDHPGVIKNRESFSARGAGILGIANFGRDHTYALNDDDMTPNLDVIASFFERHKGQPVLIFGFTFMVWRYFCQALRDVSVDFGIEDAVLLHSGGWKKLQDEAVDNAYFKQTLAERFNIRRVHNFYGMVEQVGSVFVECEHGRLHAPSFAEVLIRDPFDWSLLPAGQEGVIQVMSALPTSYPGHSLLTEDVGHWIGVDDCPCGRMGRSFGVTGRVKRAELRGCSDTHATEVSNANTALSNP